MMNDRSAGHMAAEPGPEHGPLVSITVPVYNEARFIEESLGCLVNQTYRNIEILASDNCSTDGTWDIIQKFAARDPRVKTHRQAHNLGMVKNARTAFGMAHGEFVMLGCGNDRWAPTLISSCMGELLSDPSVVLAYSRARWMDVNGKPLTAIPTNLDTRGMCTASRVNVVLWGLGYYYQVMGVFRRAVLDGYDWKTTIAPDGVILLKAALMGAFAQVPDTLLHVRLAANEMTPAAAIRRLYDENGKEIRLTPDQLYYEIIRDYVALVKAHFPPGLEQNALVSSVVLACATRHRHNYQASSRAAAGAPPAPVRSDVESVIERFAHEFDNALFGQESTEEVLRRTAEQDVLRQFTTEELVSMMTYREIAYSIFKRIKKGVRRRFGR